MWRVFAIFRASNPKNRFHDAKSVGWNKICERCLHFRRHRTGENALLRATSFLAKASDFSGVEPEKSLGLSLLLPRSLLCGLRALGRFRRHRTAEIARLRETEFHANAWGKLFVFRNAKCVSPQTPLRFFGVYLVASQSFTRAPRSERVQRHAALRR